MPKAAANPMTRAMMVLIPFMAMVLAFAIYILANPPSPGAANDTSGKQAAANLDPQAEEVREHAVARVKTLEAENSSLRQQFELAKTNLKQEADKRAAAESEAARLRSDLEAAKKQAAAQQIADAIPKDKDSGGLNVADINATDKPAVADVNPIDAKVPDAKVAQDPGPNANANNRNRNRRNGNNRNKKPAVIPTKSGSNAPSFSQLDTNQDGRLSLEEYKAGFPDNPDAEKEFKSLDTNGDGFLSIDEYQAGHPIVPLARKRPKKN